MDLRYSFDPATHTLWYDAAPDAGDPPEKFNATRVFYRLPAGWRLEDTHPDLLALAGIILVHPFVSLEGRLVLHGQVSEAFAAVCRSVLAYRVEFDAELGPGALQPRTPGRTPALSFSGGVDSTAALALMPASTLLYFLDRHTLPGTENRSIYVKDSALVACDMAEAAGYGVHRIATNLEFIRRPIGFPIDWASGLPAILMADYNDLSSVSWGVVAESGYRVGHDYFIDFRRRKIFSRWDTLLRAVGLCLGAPVAGLSEVCTSTVVRSSPLAGVAQSCIRGPKNQPCLRCFKCLRKRMLDSVLDDRPLSVDEFEGMVRFQGYEKIMLKLPIKHEDVFRWMAPRLRLDGPSLTWPSLMSRLQLGGQLPEWATRWYPKSAELIPEEYRNEAIAKIGGFVDTMDDAQMREFEGWDLREASGSDEPKTSVDRLAEVLAPPP